MRYILATILLLTLCSVSTAADRVKLVIPGFYDADAKIRGEIAHVPTVFVNGVPVASGFQVINGFRSNVVVVQHFSTIPVFNIVSAKTYGELSGRPTVVITTELQFVH